MTKTAGAILIKNGKILLIKRKNTDVFEPYWSLPGGKVDEGEISRETIVREVKEETNLNFFNPVYFDESRENFPRYNWSASADIFYGHFSGNFSGNLKINEEAGEFKWAGPKEIEKMKIAFHCKKIIRDYFRKK